MVSVDSRRYRAIYEIAYDSKITSGGDQEMAVEVHQGDQVISSSTVTFNFDLKPPDPAFISPAPEILRALPASRQIRLWEQVSPGELVPKEQKIEVLVDFPDGQKRPLVRTALYVDGVLAGSSSAASATFSWDTKAGANGAHALQAKAGFF